jgi:hypothetical protein
MGSEAIQSGRRSAPLNEATTPGMERAGSVSTFVIWAWANA